MSKIQISDQDSSIHQNAYRIIPWVIFLQFGLFIFNSSVFAQHSDSSSPSLPGRPVTWEELKNRCAQPRQSDIQAPPQNIVIQCSEVRRNWVATVHGEVALPAKRRIMTAVFADKFYVDAQEKETPLATKSGSCHRYKEVEERFTVERGVTCTDILSMKGEATDFCFSYLEAMKAGQSKLVRVTDTGAYYDSCGNGNETIQVKK